MFTGDAGFPIEACLVPLFLLATIAAMYFIARILQGRAEAELERMRGDARRFDATRRELENTVQDFKDDTQEPFYSRVSDLRSQLDGIERSGIFGINRYLQELFAKQEMMLKALLARLRSLYPHITEKEWTDGQD